MLPPDSARLAGALNLTVQGVCPAATVRHGGLPGDPVVQALVSAGWAPGRPARSAPADCARLPIRVSRRTLSW